MKHLPIILASSSPFRRALLKKLELDFESISPEIDETPQTDESPQILVKRLGIEKARAATPGYGALIIGSDQVAVLDGEIIGKPKDHEDAVRQLSRASGSTVMLYASVALLNSKTGNLQCDIDSFEVTYRELTRVQIENYLLREKPYNCCGSLKAEGLGVSLLSRLRGDDPNTLIGLPLIKLVSMLNAEGVNPIPS